MIHWLVDWLIYDLMMGKQNIKQQIHGHILRAIVYFQLLSNADEIARIRLELCRYSVGPFAGNSQPPNVVITWWRHQMETFSA